MEPRARDGGALKEFCDFAELCLDLRRKQFRISKIGFEKFCRCGPVSVLFRACSRANVGQRVERPNLRRHADRGGMKRGTRDREAPILDGSDPMASLFERYRPRTWSDVVAQDKLVAKVNALRPRGLGGRAYWIAGPSGAGKTTCGRLIAKEVAAEHAIIELDASEVTPADVREWQKQFRGKPLGSIGWGILLNEAHGMRKDTIRALLVVVGAARLRCHRIHDNQRRAGIALRRSDRRPPPIVAVHRAAACQARFGAGLRGAVPANRPAGGAGRQTPRKLHPTAQGVPQLDAGRAAENRSRRNAGRLKGSD